jgi:peptidoglycan/LPS O-acetylase OafA/YrhL
MTGPRIRPLLATAAVAAVLSYGFFGHGLPQPSDHEGMAGVTAGLCLLLATVLGYAATPKPQTDYPVIVTRAAASYADPPPRPPLDIRSRASPSTLQRFRN